MRFKKENFYTLIFAAAVLIAIPLGVYYFPNENNEINSSDAQFSLLEATDVLAGIEWEDVSLPQGATAIIPADLSGKSFENNTKYNVNMESLKFSPFEISTTGPIVLIIHTYGTEGYSSEGYITASSTLKSADSSLNVICAGEALAQTLTEKGIPVLHDKTLYDEISYSKAYTLSIEAVEKHMKENPSIKYVIDIQRDSVFSQNGNCIKSVAKTEKGFSAQIAFISGSDENGADFPNWKSNLALTVALENELKKNNPKLTRGVSLMPSGYGQYTCPGFITVEIGTSGNTPEEAQTASRFLGEAFANLIIS